MEQLHWDMFDSPFGSMLAISGDSGLRLLKKYSARSARLTPAGSESRQPDMFSELRGQLDAYFRGGLREFSVRLDPQGTGFQRSVWEAVCDVPWGSTATYHDIAVRIGKPEAVRAVGRANGSNPIHIIIPCHRIIGKDGSLRGYAGGLEMKRRLLALEGNDFGGRQSSLFD